MKNFFAKLVTKISNVKLDTVLRTVLLVLALVNQILTSSGHAILPFDDETVTELVSLLFTITTSVIAWWKNNSFTDNAVKADNYLKDLRK